MLLLEQVFAQSVLTPSRIQSVANASERQSNRNIVEQRASAIVTDQLGNSSFFPIRSSSGDAQGGSNPT